MFTPSTSRIFAAALFFVPILPAVAQDDDGGSDGVSIPNNAAFAPDGEGEDSGQSLLDGNAPTGLEDSPAGFSLFPGLKVDLTGSTSYIYDSNTTQSFVADSASLFAFGFGAVAKSGPENQRGAFYGVDYNGQAYLYTDSADDFGRDPYEHYFGGYVGVNGGKTRIRVDVDYHRNNGNSIQWDRIQRETRRAASHDYGVNLGVKRDLLRGELELGFGYLLRDFDPGTGVGDGENAFTDLAWMTTPSFAPKSSIGLGVRFGNDEYDGQPAQDATTPSFRWRYRVSGKTSLHNSLGYEFRSIDSPGSQDSENLVYSGGIDWAATSKTGFGFAYYRNVQPSYVLNGEDSTNTGITLQMSNDLPGRFQLASRIGYENAEYFSSGVGTAAGRDDDFLRLSLELTHPLVITERLRGQWAIFYNHNQNDSSQALYEFDQNITGIRFGFVY